MKHTIELYKQGRYNIISDRMIEVDSHTVTKQVKKGRNLLICDCTNHTKFCKESPICIHKKFFILFPFLNLISEQARSMLMYYKVAKTQTTDSKQIRIYKQIIDDLNKFKELDFR
jgi:hypothetical protein